MKEVFKGIYHILGGIYVPEELIKSGAIIHISDTPSFTYKALIRMIKKIEPQIIIHTGDIADDIKLELRPQLLNVYKKEADKFLNRISKYTNRLVIIEGNHDAIDEINLPKNAEVYKEGSIIEINNIKFGLAHKFENLPLGCDFFLYGHDLKTEDYRYLNGIKDINIIKGKDEIVKLCYPMGTNNYRLKISRLGK